MGKSLWAIGCVLALALTVDGQGGNETGPPALAGGPVTLDPPPPPPPPQPALAVRARVGFATNELGETVLRIEVVGTPGASFLVGAVRPGTSRPVVLTVGTLDVDGRGSLERVLTTPQARALGQSEFVFRTF